MKPRDMARQLRSICFGEPAPVAKMVRAADKMEELIVWISEEGRRSNTCTYNILEEVCDNCACNRKSAQ